MAKMETDVIFFEARKDSIEKKAIEDMDVVMPFQQLVELPPFVFEEQFLVKPMVFSWM